MDKDKSSKRFNISMLCLLSLIIGSGIGAGAGYFVYKRKNGLSSDEQKIIDSYRLLKEEWLFGNEDEQLSKEALTGMISSVADENGDSYTFYTGTRSEQGLSTDGKGFGFSTHSYDGNLYITAIHLNSPAENNGNLKVGDVLTSVKRGDEDTYIFKEHSNSEIHTYLSTIISDDTKYTFNVVRGSSSFEVTLKRGTYSERLIDVIETPDDSNSGTLVVKINTFLGEPVAALKGVLSNYQAKTKRLILDLRGNGGGYVNQAEEMAKLFVKKGTLIYQMVDKNNNIITSSYQRDNPTYNFDEYGIIINSNSASASESFTLAMRAGTNCKVYGMTSYGKGIAQSFKYFSDGSVIRYTYAYVYGPERDDETMYDEGDDDDKVMCIHKKGIIPDVPYSPDYSFLGSALDYTGTLGISTYGQEYFLKALNFMYPDTYPTSYSADYHFIDAIKDYSNNLAVKYSDNTFLTAFDSDGSMSKTLNDRFIKECYDTYLDYESRLTKSVIENSSND